MNNLFQQQNEVDARLDKMMEDLRKEEEEEKRRKEEEELEKKRK